LDEIIEGTTAYREHIRSGGVQENNVHWTSHLAKNLAGETLRTKSPPGTPRSHELEEERARLRATQAMAPPLRIPLDLRLTEEELRRREMEKALEKLSHVVADLVENEDMNSAVDLVANKLKKNEIMQAAADKEKDRGNQVPLEKKKLLSQMKGNRTLAMRHRLHLSSNTLT
jgi:hypothetical protein